MDETLPGSLAKTKPCMVLAMKAMNGSRDIEYFIE